MINRSFFSSTNTLLRLHKFWLRLAEMCRWNRYPCQINCRLIHAHVGLCAIWEFNAPFTFCGTKTDTKISLYLFCQKRITILRHASHLSFALKAGEKMRVQGLRARTRTEPTRGECGGKMWTSSSLVLHLLEEFVGGILVAILLHLSQVTLLWCHGCVHLPK